VPDDLPPDELTEAMARELLANPAGMEKELGNDPESGNPIVAKNGRYGPYVTEVLPEDAPKKARPRTGSLFKSMDLDTVTLEQALRLLSLPRVVGADAEGVEITAQNGRYGPYLKKGTDSRSLTTEEQLFDITLDEALAIYAQPKQRGRAAAAPPLKELGNDPVSGQPIVVKAGRFGEYVTDGEYNATLRKDDSIEELTLERAAELLAERRAKGPAKKAAKKSAKRVAKKVGARRPAPRRLLREDGGEEELSAGIADTSLGRGCAPPLRSSANPRPTDESARVGGYVRAQVWSVLTSARCAGLVRAHVCSVCRSGPCSRLLGVQVWSVLTSARCAGLVRVHVCSVCRSGPCSRLLGVQVWSVCTSGPGGGYVCGYS